MEYDLFTTAYTGFVNELNSVVVSNYAGFVGWISGPLRTGIAIYIILLGYAIMRGAVQYPFREYVYRSLMLAALYWAVTSLYGASIAQMIVTGLPNEFASIIGGSPDGVGASMDNMYARVDGALIAMQKATETYAQEHATLSDIPGALTAIMLCIGATIIILLTAVAALFALAVGFVIVLYALFALACLAVVGPIFMAALLYDSTRGYFFSWLGAVLNFLMLSLFALLLVLIVANVAESATAEFDGDFDNIWGTCVRIIAFYILACFFFIQIPGIAASLGGGAAAMVSQFGNAVVSGGKGLASGANQTAAGAYSTGRSIGAGIGRGVSSAMGRFRGGNSIRNA